MKKSWYVKEFSEMTGVSVRMLRHYDGIGLLKPALRTDAGYRVYTVTDLLHLQHIVALKSLGFTLKQIREFFVREVDVGKLLKVQYVALKEQLASLQESIRFLRSLIRDSAQSESVEVETILQLIRTYSMKKNIKETWVGKLANKEEFDRIIEMADRYPDDKYNEKLVWAEKAFSEDIRSRLIAHFAQRDEQEVLANQKKWEMLIVQISKAIDSGITPQHAQGKDLIKRANDLLFDMYGNDDILIEAARKAVCDTQNVHPELTKEIAVWFSQAKE